jgi:hypothetical protein
LVLFFKKEHPYFSTLSRSLWCPLEAKARVTPKRRMSHRLFKEDFVVSSARRPHGALNAGRKQAVVSD